MRWPASDHHPNSNVKLHWPTADTHACAMAVRFPPGLSTSPVPFNSPSSVQLPQADHFPAIQFTYYLQVCGPPPARLIHALY